MAFKIDLWDLFMVVLVSAFLGFMATAILIGGGCL